MAKGLERLDEGRFRDYRVGCGHSNTTTRQEPVDQRSSFLSTFPFSGSCTGADVLWGLRVLGGCSVDGFKVYCSVQGIYCSVTEGSWSVFGF